MDKSPLRMEAPTETVEIWVIPLSRCLSDKCSLSSETSQCETTTLSVEATSAVLVGFDDL